MSRLLIPAFVAIALACSACGPSAPPSDPTPSATEPTAQTSDPSPSAATAPGTPVTYACTDASPVPVAWGHDQARVAFADGRTISPPKAQSASQGGGDVFVGATGSCPGDGDDIQRLQGQGTAKTIQPQAANH